MLANRLSEQSGVTVALIEAGPNDTSPYIHMPRGVAKLISKQSHLWFYATQPEPHTAMRPDYWLRGKVLGGSSSVNGMVWVRGQPADFDDLAALTSADWSWEQIGRCYEEMECHQLGAARYRGGAGPLRISLATHRNALSEAINRAGDGMGWPVKEDINEPDDGQGIGHMPRSIWRGRRQSAVVAFLRPIRGRSNLTILTDTLVQRVVFNGRRATGVEIAAGDGGTRIISAQREVIVSAGAVASPGVLERSGVGDPELLASLKIPAVHSLAAIGENATEHRALRMQWRLRRPLSFNPSFQGWRLPLSVLRYYLTREGPMAGAAMDMRACFRSRPDLTRPDIQSQFGLYSWDLARGGGNLERQHGFCAVVNPIRPRSSGAIHIRSTDPAAMPQITANYGSAQQDRADTVAAAKLLRQFAAREPLASLIDGESVPGPAAQTDEQILEALDAFGCAGMHTVGTCRMGKDADSVVDPELRVRGLTALRVVDASVMPFIPAGNTNAPVLALAWRAAEVIRRGA